ncbi:D-inositol-3-phosphate glycosyltransferase [subsurface metagenome]
MGKKKILYVIENIYFGGGERAFAQIINGLDKGKYEIYVTCLPGGIFEDKIKTFAKLLPFDLRNRFNLTRIYRLTKIMKAKNIQIVHSQGGRADFFARIAAKMAKVPAVVSTVAMPVEGFDVGLLRKGIYVILDRFSERFVDRFIVVSEALRDRLIKKHKIPSRKVVKICNGIEVEEFRKSLVSTNKIREEFNIKPDVQLVGTIGRLVYQKGLPYFIQAIKQMLKGSFRVGSKIKFLIVGEGILRNRLEKLVKRLGIENKVVFAGFRKDVKGILSTLDILVLPSILEGQPIIILEAMAMEKPIVATNIEGVNEIIKDGVTGMLVPSKDSCALAEAIIYLLRENKKAQEIGKTAREIVKQRFSVEQMVRTTECVYRELIEVSNK